MLKPPRLPTLSPEDTLLSGYERIRRVRADGLPVIGPDGLMGLLTLRSIGAIVRERMAPASGSAPGKP
jgi:CBS domain-containing protein